MIKDFWLVNETWEGKEEVNIYSLDIEKRSLPFLKMG